MKLKEALTTAKVAATTFAGRAGLKIKAYSPEILIGVGVIAIVGGTVLACKATLKVESVLDDVAEQKEKIETAHNAKLENYTDEDYIKDKTIITVQAGWNLVKLYGPAATCLIAGIVSVCASYGILKKRNAAIMAAYKAIETTFSEYRKRVIEEQGEDADRHFMYGTERKKLSVKDENGEVIGEEEVTTISGTNHSAYSRIFDETNGNYNKNAELNMLFLAQQQKFWNDRLNLKGHVFLNEIYDALGFDRSQAGAVVGWVKDSPEGDNFIDFGIFQAHDERKCAFVNGYERAIVLDFNVDGVIYDKI